LRWEREDSAYLAATLLAGTLVAYVVAANFGLVPTPLGKPGRVPSQAAGVPAFEARSVRFLAPPVFEVPRAAAPLPRPRPAARPARVDRTPPTVAITTSSGTQLAVASSATVAGTAGDDGSGVGRVDVVYTRSGGPPSTVTARLSCGATAGERCTWQAGLPDAIGTYSVVAVATDRASNHGTAQPIDVSVIDLNKVTGGAVSGTVHTAGGLIDVISSVLRELLGNGPR